MPAPTLGPTSIAIFSEGRTGLSGEGPCTQVDFTVIGGTPFGQILPASDDVRAMIQYDAPGCATVGGFIAGNHVRGSPWYEHFCGESSEFVYPCRTSTTLTSQFKVDAVLTTPTGTLTLIGMPDATTPPTDVNTNPSVEGFVFCSVVLTFKDGTPGGSAYYRQIDFKQTGGPCDTCIIGPCAYPAFPDITPAPRTSPASETRAE